MTVLSIDFETRSAANLKQVGSARYAADSSTDVWCMAWALDDDPVSVWYPHDGTVPHRVLDHIESGGIVTGWNIRFELDIWQHVILRDHPDWPAISIDQADDTMARAYAAALPGSLDGCAQAVGIEQQKDSTGYRLMMRMCQPTLAWRKNPVGDPVWHEDKADLKRLGDYCAQDVIVERELRKRLDPLTVRERAVWLLDQRINTRGVHVDILAVESALKLVAKDKARLTEEIQRLTGGAVHSPNAVDALLEWLQTQGVELDNLKKRPVSRFLRSNAEMTPEARRALQIRLEASKASTAKLKAMIVSRDDDGSCRGLFSYHVATTGRWAGRRIQLQNLMRPDEEIFKTQADIDYCIELFKDQYFAEDLVRLNFDNPIPAVASCMRGMIVPEPGHLFIGGDFTGIENRVLMWLAGEDWMIDEFIKFDAGKGVDNYKLTYSRSFGIPIEAVTKQQRLIGKVGALACGFAGAVGAYMGMGDNYDVVPGDVAKAARAAVTDYEWDLTKERYPKEEIWRFGLDPDTWTGIKIVVDKWRAAHPNVTRFWYDLSDCAIGAIQSPGKIQMTETTKIKFVCDPKRNFLIMRLPSGRYLSYPRPHLKEEKFGNQMRLVPKAWGLDRKTKRHWVPRVLTPQILSENATSGTARDVLVDAMFRAEDNGYPIVMHVHDEIVSAVRISSNSHSADEFRKIMCDSKPWLSGLPVSAQTWEGSRFQK